MGRLTHEEFLRTLSSPMRRIVTEAEPPFDFRIYFEQIPSDDFEGYDC